MRRVVSLVFVLAFGLVTLGCSDLIRQKSNVSALPQIDQSFSVFETSVSHKQDNKILFDTGDRTAQDSDITPTQDRARIRINKEALEKEFLWHASLINQIPAPQFSGLKSRIVAFRQRSDTLYLLEAAHGHTVTHDLPQTLILAAFPIVYQDDTVIEFDFNRGMSELFIAGDWRASDFEGATHQGNSEFISVPVRHSYIERAELTKNNELLIVQHAVLTVNPLGMNNTNTAIVARHYFSPYAPNANYKPAPTADFDRMGFFEVAPLLLEGSQVQVYASRFDPNPQKAITYAISANTPKEFRSAVREGILYWNRAFGYEKIKVIEAPEHASAPDPEYNIVQWVPWDAAGSAYADAQMDPRTGEIRHAQVYMTSAFAFSSRIRALALKRKLEASSPRKTIISLSGHQHSALCDRDDSSHLQKMLTELVNAEVPDERILEVSRDYIREVMAHEIGHTLGFRHNFAGNLVSNFDISDLDGMFNTYLKTGEVKKDVVFTSSVMEYSNFASATMAGKQIVLPGEAFSYDKAATGVLYRDEKINASELPLFCTDSHRGRFVGCDIWDQGPSPLADSVYNEKKYLESLPQTLLEMMIQAKSPSFGAKVRSIEEVPLNPKAISEAAFARRAFIINMLTTSLRDLKTHRSFAKADGLNEKAIKEKSLDAAVSEINRLGGLKTLLAMPSDSLADNWIEAFNTLIDSPAYRSGIGYNGEEYSFSDKEVEQAKAIAAEYFAQIQEHLALSDIRSLSKHVGKILDAPIAEDLADVMMSRMNEYILGESGDVIRDRVVLSDNKTAILKLPVYKYPHEVRVAAAGLFLNREAELLDWGYRQQITIKTMFEDKLNSLLMNTPIGNIKVDKNPRAVGLWLIENKAVSGALNSLVK